MSAVAIIVGWPSLVLGVGLTACGLALRWLWLTVIGVVASLGFCIFVTSTNAWPIGMLLFVAQMGVALAEWRDRHGLAWVLLAPLVVVPPFLFHLVASTFRVTHAGQ